jgi:predicted metal-dependent peptidase
MRTSNKFEAAKIKLVMDKPFFATLFLSMQLKEEAGINTMWVDGKTLGYDPVWAESRTLAELEFILCHEMMHVALGHHLRVGGRDPELWNEACDYAINSDLVRSGMRAPADALLDPQYDGKIAEHIYTLLQAKKQQQKKQEQGGGQGQPKKSPSTGSFKQPALVDEAALAEAEAELREQVAVAAQMSRAAGNLPGSIERSLASTLQPKVDWREALQRFFHRKAKDDHSWNKRSRRSFGDVLLPGRWSDSAGVIAVAVDVSGSIDSKMLQEFGAELEAIREDLRPERTLVLYFDHRVSRVEDLGPDDRLHLTITGGGGTSFQAAQEWLESHEVEPDALVYLTDMEGAPGASPVYPVLWASTTGDRPAWPYGEVISMI